MFSCENGVSFSSFSDSETDSYSESDEILDFGSDKDSDSYSDGDKFSETESENDYDKEVS
jgi:hypothetical protein